MSRAQETKTFSGVATKVLDADQGIVEHIVAVMGNIDRGNDVLHPGAFSKTIMERGLKVKVLDQHNTSSVRNIVARPLELREVGRLELPPDLLNQYPDATGALKAKTQFLLDTEEGLGVFKRIKSGAVDEYSIGYDPITTDYSTIETPGGKKTVRNLREVRLWEYSPVVWGLNPATQTLSAKGEGPAEAKPYGVVHEGGKWRVYKLGADGKPTGDALGEHDTEEEARAQQRALYANEPKDDESPGEEKAVMKTEADGKHPASHYLVVEDGEKPSTWHLRVRNVSGDLDHRLMGAAWAALHGGYRGNKYEGPNKQEAIAKLRRLYASENMDTPKEGEDPEEDKAGRVIAKRNAERLKRVMTELVDLLKDGGLWEEDEAEEKDQDAPVETQAADDTPEDEAVGPDIPPTAERLAVMRQLQADMLEVE